MIVNTLVQSLQWAEKNPLDTGLADGGNGHFFVFCITLNWPLIFKVLA
jgi:hypothetical protein